jgi:tetratricopeptide (TPR) repeat protein
VLNSHNLYLDVALEQGIIGALALILVYLGGLRAVFPRAATSLLCRASFVSLLVLLFHGLVDNIIYDPGGAALVFLLPGIALAASRAEGDIPGRSPIVDFFRGRGYLAGAVAVAALLIFAFAQRQQLIAAWNADLGAVEMSRVELADFPTNRWDEGQNLDRLRPAEAHFLRALQADPNQRTANHRLGLIALQRRDFATAADYLERAHRADPGHHGITKALAYSYIWAGWPGKAMPLLGDIPEARGEMAVYAWWWQEQDRADLARQAIVVAGLLQSAPPAAAQK